MRGGPKIDLVLGRGRLVEARIPTGSQRGGMHQLPVEVGVGVGADGFGWWVGKLGPDGSVLPRLGNSQVTAPWGPIRVRVSAGPPTRVRIVHHAQPDTVLELLDATPDQVIGAVARYDADALRDDDPPVPTFDWENIEDLDPIDVEVSEEPDEPGELLIGFSDPIAHDYQHLVKMSVDVVRAVPGITRASQTDTELITAYGTVQPDEVKRALHQWWDEQVANWRDMR